MLYSTSRDARWPQLVPGIISRSGRLQVAGRDPMGGRRAHRGPDHWAGPGPAPQRQPGLSGTVAAGRPPGPAACTWWAGPRRGIRVTAFRRAGSGPEERERIKLEITRACCTISVVKLGRNSLSNSPWPLGRAREIAQAVTTHSYSPGAAQRALGIAQAVMSVEALQQPGALSCSTL